MSYLPCDFHPVLLVLGLKDELRQFADVLAVFADNGDPVVVNDAGVFSTDTKITIRQNDAADGPDGLWPNKNADGQLVWRLTREQAQSFSDEVAELSLSAELAGSVTLESEVLGEVRVKVSMGEWEDQYLTTDFR